MPPAPRRGEAGMCVQAKARGLVLFPLSRAACDCPPTRVAKGQTRERPAAARRGCVCKRAQNKTVLFCLRSCLVSPSESGRRLPTNKGEAREKQNKQERSKTKLFCLFCLFCLFGFTVRGLPTRVAKRQTRGRRARPLGRPAPAPAPAPPRDGPPWGASLGPPCPSA